MIVNNKQKVLDIITSSQKTNNYITYIFIDITYIERFRFCTHGDPSDGYEINHTRKVHEVFEPA